MVGYGARLFLSSLLLLRAVRWHTVAIVTVGELASILNPAHQFLSLANHSCGVFFSFPRYFPYLEWYQGGLGWWQQYERRDVSLLRL